MTVSTTINKEIGEGNGVATVFPFTFGTLPGEALAGDLVVSLFDLDGLEIPQVEGADYAVTGEGAEDGGAVVFTVPPTDGYMVLIRRILPLTQPTDIKNQGSFYPKTIERMFADRLVYIAQQQQERIDASMQLPPQVDGVSTFLPVPENNTIFGWNEDGTAIKNFPLSSIATSIVYGNKIYNTFVGTGAQTQFLLSEDPGSIGNLDVSIDGVTQVPGSDYTLSNRTVTFTTAPASAAVILIRFDKAMPIGVSDSALAAYTPPQTGVLNTVKVFLDSLWSAGDSVGGALIRFLQSGAGAVARTLQSKMREQLTPQDFGALGNGVANDTAAMAAFFAQLQLTGSIGFLPAGTYNVTSGFSINSAITVRGSKQARIYNTNSALAAPVIHVGPTGADRTTIEGFSIDSVPVANANAHGIQVDGGNDFILRGLNIGGVQIGINVPLAQSGAQIDGCLVHNTISHGYVIDGGNLVINGSYAIYCGGSGFRFTAVTGVSGGITMNSCTAFGVGIHGFSFEGNATHNLGDVFLNNCVNSYSTQHGYMVDTYGKNIMLTGCFSEVAGNLGFRFTQNNHRVTVTGCQSTFSNFSGMSMECSYFSITGGDYCANNTSGSAQAAGILVGATGAVSNFNIVGVNTVPMPVADINQQIYGINFFSGGNANGVVSACNLSGTSLALGIFSSPTVLVTNCVGYKNEVWGTATITTGSAVVTVNHGLSGIPTIAIATPNDVNISPNIFWTGSKSGTTFNINMSATRGSDTVFSYYARL